MLSAAPLATRLLDAAPRLKLLVTSREPLRVRDERVVVVFILSLVFAILGLISPLAGAAAVVAFIAGVYPNAGLRQITRYANRADLIRGFCWRHLAQLAEAKQADEADGPITKIAGSPQI